MEKRRIVLAKPVFRWFFEADNEKGTAGIEIVLKKVQFNIEIIKKTLAIP